MALALQDSNRAPDQFSQPVTAANAETIIERAFKTEIQTILSRLDAQTLPISVAVLLSEDHDTIDFLVTANACGVMTPDWFDDDTIDNAIKAAVWHTLRTHLRGIVPMGDLSDLINFYDDYYWQGAKTDEEARVNLTDSYGEDPFEHIMMPSEMAAATPKWTKAPTKRQLKRLPTPVAEAIDAVKKAAAQFEKRPKPIDAWDFTYDAVVEIEPAYEESAAMPPLWLVPLNEDLVDALDDIAQHAMQTS